MLLISGHPKLLCRTRANQQVTYPTQAADIATKPSSGRGGSLDSGSWD